MPNTEVIIVNGMRRGGTNIVWNLLQSHPRIVSPVLETGQVIYPVWMRRGRAGNLLQSACRLLARSGYGPYLRRVDRLLYLGKLSTLEHPDNKYKSENQIYTKDELEKTVLAMKSVDEDVFITPPLSEYYSHSCCVSVVRNGLAVCEGRLRRGVPIDKAANAYRRIALEMLRQHRVLERHLFVKFEECLSDPTGQLVRMCRFSGVDPDEIGQLRIKLKPIIGRDASTEEQLGADGEKVWLSEQDVNRLLDTSVTSRQISRLTHQQKETVLNIAGDAMQRLGYDAESAYTDSVDGSKPAV